MDDLAFDHRRYVSLRLFLTTQLKLRKNDTTPFLIHMTPAMEALSIQAAGSKKRSTTNKSTKGPNRLSMVELRNGVIECGGVLEHSGAAVSTRPEKTPPASDPVPRVTEERHFSMSREEY
eukprot:scaffold12161_cov81-Skeletonema_dohrnii-CCMP3373.AAC.9